MVKWSVYAKNPKYGKIGSAKVYSRLKILLAGGLMGLSVALLPIYQQVGFIIALFSALVFVWDIFGQSKSAIDVEKRISDLETSAKEYKEKFEKLENQNNTKSDNQ